MQSAMRGASGWRLETSGHAIGALLLGALLCGGAVACVEPGPDWLDMDAPYQGPGDDPSTGPGNGTSGSGSEEGIPCEVEAVLATHCWSCHGATPPALDSLAALKAPSDADPSRTVAEVSVDTMLGVGAPMPPAGLLDGIDVAIVEDWVAAGMPGGACGEPSDPGPDPYDTPVQCSTDTYWTQGDEGKHEMYPGRACIDCHQAEGPDYRVAGTAFPTAHEPDDCFGTLADLPGGSVVITDANGTTHSLAIRRGGNFSLKDDVSVAFPITAEVVVDGQVLAMQAPIDAAGGDCNTCHSQDGEQGAPGRILLP
jgi:mono/diheme cytochrome c family protein